MLAQSGLFPLRFLGFGFFWGWLFLVNLSPSPLFGAPHGLGGIPFEMSELSFRIVLLIAFAAFSGRIANARHRLVFICISCVTGALTTPVMVFFDGPLVVTFSSVLAAATEVTLFLGWITFFGYMKLGETLLLLVASYAVGAVVSLGSMALGHTAMVFFGTALPLASLVAFVLSHRLYDGSLRNGKGTPAGSDGVDALSADVAFAGPLFGGVGGQTKQGDQDVKAAGEADGTANYARYVPRLTAGLFLYSFAFALYLGIALFLKDDLAYGYIVEPTCAIALACVYAVVIKFAHDPTRPYGLYRTVPMLCGGGFALLAVGFSQPLLAGAFITMGFLTFELMAYNDYCNIVKADNTSLLKAIASARLASSVGMLIGWMVGYGMQPVMQATGSGTVLAVFALFVVLCTATLAFTDRDRQALVSIADDQAVNEDLGTNLHKEDFYESYAESIGLSKRETEVLSLLLGGRTTSYAAEKLFVAESTIRAHVHNIYRKADVHSRMELMDAFDAFWKDASRSRS